MKKHLLILVLLALQASHSLNAAFHTVDNRQGRAADFTAIQAAIDAALPGDTIYIMGSDITYGVVTLNKLLTLYGPGYFLGSNSIATANRESARIKRMSITRTAAGSQIIGISQVQNGSSQDYLTIECDNLSFRRCWLEEQVRIGNDRTTASQNISFEQCILGRIGDTTGGVYVGTGTSQAAGASNIVLSNCLVRFIRLAPIGSECSIDQCVLGGADVRNSTIRNSIFTNTYTSSLDATTTVDHCLAPADILPDGDSNVETADMSTVFVGWNVGEPPATGTTADTWTRLIPNQVINPAIGAGTDGQDLGMFGGSFPYVVSGVPPLPRIKSMVAPVVVEEGESLTIEVETTQGE